MADEAGSIEREKERIRVNTSWYILMNDQSPKTLPPFPFPEVLPDQLQMPRVIPGFFICNHCLLLQCANKMQLCNWR